MDFYVELTIHSPPMSLKAGEIRSEYAGLGQLSMPARILTNDTESSGNEIPAALYVFE